MVGFCFVMQYFVPVLQYSHLWKRELVAFLLLCFECHVAVIVL